MRLWLTSQYRAMFVTVIGVLLIIASLLVVISRQGLSERSVGASLLVLSATVFMLGGILFTGRAFLKWPSGETVAHMRWERGSIIVATLATVLGLVLLADMLHAAGDTYLAQLGMVTYLFGALLAVVAELAFLSSGEWHYPQILCYVILAFLAQAAIGAALLQTGLLASWVGWFTVIWNLGLLLIMLIVRPRDIYYPVIHFLAPLIIGLALLAGGWAL